jgi:hypothetical protein
MWATMQKLRMWSSCKGGEAGGAGDCAQSENLTAGAAAKLAAPNALATPRQPVGFALLVALSATREWEHPEACDSERDEITD